ncbi:MAG TPA: hypothetical protein VFS77_06300, partial [Pyrinomonadaceae bacterium]|nr:hypothetical protein [Pyrinomonadaceae bacterium]
ISLSPADAHTTHARLRIEQPAKVTGVGNYLPSKNLTQERGTYVVPLKKSVTQIELNEVSRKGAKRSAFLERPSLRLCGRLFARSRSNEKRQMRNGK